LLLRASTFMLKVSGPPAAEAARGMPVHATPASFRSLSLAQHFLRPGNDGTR
jgi:hypothetical protein